ncbi:MAG: hypothetical protein K6U89_16720, partial [Chloroflexi bacterium]|nr:hypothetical protein [Chloroflexota bacterium]
MEPSAPERTVAAIVASGQATSPPPPSDVTALTQAVSAATGQPVLPAAPLPHTPHVETLRVALRRLGVPEHAEPPAPPPDPAAVLTARQRLEAATQRLLELERE